MIFMRNITTIYQISTYFCLSDDKEIFESMQKNSHSHLRKFWISTCVKPVKTVGEKVLELWIKLLDESYLQSQKG